MATSEPWVRNWRVQWQGPWRVLDECPYPGAQHNTETAAVKGCICPRAITLKPVVLAKRRVIGARSYARNRVERVQRQLKIQDPVAGSVERPNVTLAACGTSAGRVLHEDAIDKPNTRVVIDAAKHVCRRCPIMLDCRNWVLGAEKDPGNWGGVYGGLSAKERVRIRLASSTTE